MAAASSRKVSLGYLERLTDDFGIWQHTRGAAVDAAEGYALDDAARALAVALEYGRDDLAAVYGGFVRRACLGYAEPVNFFSAAREPVFSRGWSADALGQVIWALGLSGGRFGWAGEARARVLPLVIGSPSLRPLAYASLADACDGAGLPYAERVISACEPEWYWPEEALTYANAVVPWALIAIGERHGRDDIRAGGLRMLDFLNGACQEGGVPIAIGNKGWFPRGGAKALYDQQPIDPAYQALANAEAFRVTGDERYRAQAGRFFGWFWGGNLGGATLVDSEGGCRDGLWEHGVSPNRGAESVVCYLLAQAALAL